MVVGQPGVARGYPRVLAAVTVALALLVACGTPQDRGQPAPTTSTEADTDATTVEDPSGSSAGGTTDALEADADDAEAPDTAVDDAREGQAENGSTAPDNSTSGVVSGDLEVHYLDVGQADATLLLHAEVAILIDAGHWQRSDVVPALRDAGVDTLDLVVVTHPHADHIGQFAQVMEAFDVAEVWWSGSVTTTQTFERAVATLEGSDTAYEEPRAGASTTLGPLAIDIVNPPAGVDLTDLHDAGLGLRITYGEVSLLFTGDAESAAESRMLSASAAQLSSDIVQLGHHGSSTSTTPSFLAAVDPAVAIYSSGAGNQYGHPHAEVVDRVVDAGVDLYGTDVHGTVVLTTDGTTWTIATHRQGAPTTGDDRGGADPGDRKATGGSGSGSGSGNGSGDSGSGSTDGSAPDDGTAAPGACAPGQVDINSAGLDDLQRIHQVGPDRGRQILELRPFSSVQAMDRISGIGPARLAEIIDQGVACAG